MGLYNIIILYFFGPEVYKNNYKFLTSSLTFWLTYAGLNQISARADVIGGLVPVSSSKSRPVYNSGLHYFVDGGDSSQRF